MTGNTVLENYEIRFEGLSREESFIVSSESSRVWERVFELSVKLEHIKDYDTVLVRVLPMHSKLREVRDVLPNLENFDPALERKK